MATSVENFQDRLPRIAVRRLKGSKFDAVQARDVFDQIFEATIDGTDQQLWLGPDLCRMLVDRQNDHYRSIQAFTDALKVSQPPREVKSTNDCSMYTCVIFMQIRSAYLWILAPLSTQSQKITSRLRETFIHFAGK